MPKIEKELFVDGVRKWFAEYANYKSSDDYQAVIGLSGGKDSSVVAALLTEALGAKHVNGVIIPNGRMRDDDYGNAYNLAEYCLNIPNAVVNIGPMVDKMLEECQWHDFGDIREKPAVTTNLPARMRMTTLYTIANNINGRVIGTGNKSEIICSYYTLWGDGSCDFDPIADLFVDEVIELGRQLNLPEEYLLKPPDDGMSGKTDEEKLGFKYDDVKTFWTSTYEDGVRKLGKDLYCKIADRVDSTHFKRNLTHIPYIDKKTGKLVNIN